MKRKIDHFYIIIFFLLTVSSCLPVKYTSFEVLKPAQITIPAGIKSVSLISAKNELNFPEGKLNNINNIKLKKDFNYHQLSWDYLYGMMESMNNSPRFEKVVVSSVDIFNFYSNNGYNWEELIKINRIDSTNAIIIIEDYVLNDSLEYYEILYEPCYVAYNLVNNVKWTVLFPKYQEIIQKSSSNTLKWERDGDDCNNALRSFPDGWDILRESAYTTGTEIGLEIAPAWEKNEERYYYNYGNKLIKEGSIFAKNEDWESAKEKWLLAIELKNERTRAKAAYNLALAYELEDDLDKALEMINYSDSLYSNYYSIIYQINLKKRLKERKVLDEQMNITK